MVGFKVTKRKQKTREISWPVESNRNPVVNADPPPSTSVPSLYSGSTDSSTEGANSRPQSRARFSFGSTSKLRPSTKCSVDDCSSIGFSMDSPSKLPSEATLEEAGNVPIFDADGNSRPFKSLYSGNQAIGEQQLIIFVRHFFCGACQSYLKELSCSISLKTYFTLPVPTSITIIGLGSPSLIPIYRQFTGTPFPIFTDPTRRLHKLLGMGWSMNLGARPRYFSGVNEVKWIVGQLEQIKAEDKEVRFKGGAWWWVGGEFLIRDGKLIWCHRMKNYRDHVEMDVLKRLLSVESSS